MKDELAYVAVWVAIGAAVVAFWVGLAWLVTL